MTSTRSRVLRPFAALAAAAALAATAVLALAVPASAHDQLVSTDPADGSTVATMPTQVTLTFNAEVLAGGGNEVVVTDAAGTALADGPATVDGVNIVQQLTGEGSGVITVQWRAVSSDGHPVSGQFAFTAPAAAPTPEESAAASQTPEPTMTTLVEPAPSPTESAPAAEDSASALPWIVGAVVVLVIIAVVVVLLVRPRGSGTPGGTGSGGAVGR
ncbi:copper resistance protein CopC [Microbacterium sp. NPDC091313]